jgi:flagellar motor switch protein FliG
MADETASVSPPRLTGSYAAAILLLLLEEQDAAAVMQAFDPSDIQQLGKSMFDAAKADERQIETALGQFIDSARVMPSLAPKAGPHIKNVLTAALGNEKARSIMDSVAPQQDSASLEALKWMDAEAIGRILAAEHPQVGAVILSALDPEIAATALAMLADEQQADLMLRTARLGPVSSDALADIDAIIAAHAGGGKKGGQIAMGGKSETARIINKLRKDAGSRIIEDVKKRDQLVGQQIEDEMFVFENLLELDDKNLGVVMRGVDSAALSLALKGASEELAERILGCMSARAAQTIRDEMEERGMVKRAEVEDAQKVIIAVARQLAEEGAIMIGTAGDDYV